MKFIFQSFLKLKNVQNFHSLRIRTGCALFCKEDYCIAKLPYQWYSDVWHNLPRRASETCCWRGRIAKNVVRFWAITPCVVLFHRLFVDFLPFFFIFFYFFFSLDFFFKYKNILNPPPPPLSLSLHSLSLSLSFPSDWEATWRLWHEWRCHSSFVWHELVWEGPWPSISARSLAICSSVEAIAAHAGYHVSHTGKNAKSGHFCPEFISTV